MERLNDTEALVRQGIRSPQLKTASGGTRTFGDDDAAGAVSGPQPGRFQRETGAGNEHLTDAIAFAGKE